MPLSSAVKWGYYWYFSTAQCFLCSNVHSCGQLSSAVLSLGYFVSPLEYSINGDWSPGKFSWKCSGVTSHLCFSCSVAFLLAMHLLTWKRIHPPHIITPICLLWRQTSHMSLSRDVCTELSFWSISCWFFRPLLISAGNGNQHSQWSPAAPAEETGGSHLQDSSRYILIPHFLEGSRAAE